MATPLQTTKKARVICRLAGSDHLGDEVAGLQALHGALADHVADVVLVVRQPVQREGGVVLQVAVAAVQQVQQRWQAPGLRRMQTRSCWVVTLGLLTNIMHQQSSDHSKPPDCDACHAKVENAVTRVVCWMQHTSGAQNL